MDHIVWLVVIKKGGWCFWALWWNNKDYILLPPHLKLCLFCVLEQHGLPHLPTLPCSKLGWQSRRRKTICGSLTCSVAPHLAVIGKQTRSS
ncbi:hypothetical protein SLEP1_g21759 [Rubroshorea leprosula]|uniref:Secreted protein n=1 Tax=Rubroshorea leprosula TaxID=152421 RepID=A0AAV5J727_9ROSI|nr:hypothetical protein SLEP1_g21759 [Rubroshorea leprosula]